MDKNQLSFSEMELDALGELLNISFGSAVADLAGIFDIFINLNVPFVKIIRRYEIFDYISNEIPNCIDCSIVEQKYHGNWGGTALLVFPYGIEKKLISYFEQPSESSYSSDGVAELEKEVLMEIGNILIGACLSKIFELLDTRVIYFPPTASVGGWSKEMLLGSDSADDFCITLETKFSFEDRNVEGHLFLIIDKESVPRLKKALRPFTGAE